MSTAADTLELAELSISSTELELSTVAGIVAEHRIAADISPRLSVSSSGKIESGARLSLYDTSPAAVLDLWRSLSAELSLHCAYIVAGDYRGCIIDCPILSRE